MKKFLIFGITVIMLFSLAASSGQNKDPVAGEKATATSSLGVGNPNREDSPVAAGDEAEGTVTIDEGPYMENYKDIPELPNAEPNWNDTPGAANEDTTGNLETGAWEVTIDQDFYMENYKDIPELPSAEPNWVD